MALRVLTLTLAALGLATPAHAQVTAACNDDVPDRITPVVLGTPMPIEVRALVMLDGVTRTQAAKQMAGAAKLFEPVGVRLTVGRFQDAALTADAAEALQKLKRHAGGRRPADSHLVVGITSRDLTAAGDRSLNGMALCLGGVDDPTEAFVVFEHIDGPGGGLISGIPDGGPRLAAHEVGHVLGAHHEHANCAQSASSGPPDSACTLMFPIGTTIGTEFGTLEASVIRAYVEDYAKRLAPPRRRAARGRGGRR